MDQHTASLVGPALSTHAVALNARGVRHDVHAASVTVFCPEPRSTPPQRLTHGA